MENRIKNLLIKHSLNWQTLERDSLLTRMTTSKKFLSIPALTSFFISVFQFSSFLRFSGHDRHESWEFSIAERLKQKWIQFYRFCKFCLLSLACRPITLSSQQHTTIDIMQFSRDFITLMYECEHFLVIIDVWEIFYADWT